MDIEITQVVGIVLGSVLIVSVAIVWLRKQVLGFGGLGMCVIGTLLMSLTIWQNVQLEVSKDGATLKLAAIERRLDEAESRIEQTTAELAEAEQINLRLRSTVVALGDVTAQQTQAYQQLQQQLVRRNVIDNPAQQPQLMIRPEVLRDLELLQRDP
ncbi:MAG: hypothetical protein AAFO81_04955 [Pseudomonadota bacterium]